MRGGKCRRLSDYQSQVQSGNLHNTVGSGCCGSGLGTGTGLAGALSAADSESPLATGTTMRLRHGFSDFSN